MELQELTQESLKKFFSYDSGTGLLVRIKSVQGAPAGQEAYARKDKYKRIRFAGGEHYAHRLAWLYVYGSLPVNDIDHIDGNPSNNAISNLREATASQNSQNVRHTKGVSIHKQSGLWRCRLNKLGKCIVNTYHKTQEEARDAYIQAKRQYHEFAVI